MGKLDGKVAIVTGSTSGMGRDSAKLFAAEGAKVVVTGRNEERAKAVVDDIKSEGNEAIYVIADMGNVDDIKKIFDTTIEEYGTVDILFNNAGILSTTPLLEMTKEEWDEVFDVDVYAALYLTQLVAPIMKEKGKGSIINTCSIASFAGHFGFVGYISSKHAIAGLTKSIAFELGPEIRCNGIAPGAIHTAMVDGIGGVDALQMMIQASPVKRVGQGEDIAALALFLASDESEFVDGQIIRCDGGLEC
ncbi:SDR family NAD(P)-dependent oxidoreductase [Methanobrevibacter sp.]|uniref:SDR family NAD(P)-dependent oxidoreductase n=1 Tax=Methanobrevibacter sp. TaxID=66852 RepID=UPI0026DFF1B0|nr:glucose 1-dehydrogenase [Methanobrevibacter sp.]MDO5824516.1 glucose 1-dehydrogenase [Methanobrevibacter sp.]